MKIHKSALLTALIISTLGGASSNAATVIWDPDVSSNPFNMPGLDTPPSPNTITLNDKLWYNSNAYQIPVGTTLVVENGGGMENARDNKVTRSANTTITVDIEVNSGGFVAENKFRSVDLYFSGSGEAIFYSANPLEDATIYLASGWTGSLWFGETNAADFQTSMASGGVLEGDIVFGGNALTDADLGVKYQLTEILAGTNGAPSLNKGEGGVDGAGVYLTLVVPEPSSSALLGLGGLALILRRRKI